MSGICFATTANHFAACGNAGNADRATITRGIGVLAKAFRERELMLKRELSIRLLWKNHIHCWLVQRHPPAEPPPAQPFPPRIPLPAHRK